MNPILRNTLIVTLFVSILLPAVPTPAMAATSAPLSPTEMLIRAERLQESGEYTEAEKVYDSLLNIPGLRRSFEFQALDGRARCRKLLARYGEAAEDYDRALSLPASDLNRVILTLNKSDLLISTGQYREAERLLRDTDTISELPTQARRRLFANLASIKKYEGEFELSRDIYHSILEMESSQSEKAFTLQNLGILYLDLGDPGKAVELLQQAYNILSQEQNGGKNAAIVLANLAVAQAIAGDPKKAVENIDTAIIEIGKYLGKDHPDYLTALRKKGEIYLMSDSRQGALDAFKPYFSNLRRYILLTLPSMTEQARLDYWKKERPLISEIFATENCDPQFLADAALLRRAIALTGADKAFGEKGSVKLSVTANDIIKKLKPDEIAVDFVIYPNISTAGERTDKLAAIILYPLSSGRKPEFISYGEVRELENRKIGNRTLLSALRSTSDADKNLIYSDTTLFRAIWNPVLAAAPQKGTIYFAPDGFLNLLAIESLPSPSDTKANSLNFRRCSSLSSILKPSSAVSSRSKTVLNPAGKQFLVAGGFDYNRLPEQPTTSYRVNPPNHDAYNFLSRMMNGATPDFQTLPGMRTEAHTIGDLMRNAIVTDTLTEENFKERVPKIKRLHLATHGYTLDNKEAPVPFSMRDSVGADNSLLASGLVLSGANIASRFTGREDGLLSARELCDLDLSTTECVVLAACQTALGEISDEGPAGLLRGLKKAGAGTVLATLWEVDDNATLLFMTEFYNALNNGKSYSEAYELAKKGVRNHKITVPVTVQRFDPATLCTVYEESGETEEIQPFAEPAFWAPFILVDAPY